MILFNLAWRNVKRNFGDYFLYFTSMVFSIMIYFTFVSIKYNEQVLNLSQARQRIASAFSASSIILAIFALIFIWYSNAFFTRKRKNEIGLYSLLGVKRRQIGQLLFYENMFMGILALLIGIFFGSLLSKVFVMLLVRLMGFSVAINFQVIPEAILGTIKAFAVLFLLTSIQGYTIIYRYKLIDLFQAEKMAEKKPHASIITAILSLILIIGGYWFYLTSSVNFLYLILFTLISVVIGTYLFFSSLTVFIIKLARKQKQRFYTGINMISTANLLYRIKGHARTLATIAVLSATTLTAISVTASLYYDFKTKLDFAAPFSYVIMTNSSESYTALSDEIDNKLKNYPEQEMKKAVNFNVIPFTAELPVGINGSYSTQNVYLMPESKYNEIAKIRGIAQIHLANTGETIFIDEFYNQVFKEDYTDKIIKIKDKAFQRNFQIVNFKTRPILNIAFLLRTMVVKDEVYQQVKPVKKPYQGKAIKISAQQKSSQLTSELTDLIEKYRSENSHHKIWFSSYYKYYQNGIINSGQAMFIGAFLGLVFLISTGSIIFFKLLSEAQEEIMRYRILSNIGVSRQEIRKLLAKQILFVFALPLLVGIIHSLVATTILEKILMINLTLPIIITIIAYTVIYMAYYFIAVNSYNKIVNKNQYVLDR